MNRTLFIRRALVAMALGALSVWAQGPAKTAFSDIAARPMAVQTAIGQMVSQGIMQGRSAKEFAPDAPLTRAEFAASLQKMFNLPQPAQAADFPDVPRTSPYYAAVQALTPHLSRSLLCFRCALVKNFSLSETVSRAEMTMIMAHILVSRNKVPLLNESETNAALAGVADAQRIPAPARPYFAAAIKNGVVDLKPGKTIALPLAVSRGETAECMANVQKKFSMPVLRPVQ
jgi:S-layer homology domain